MAVNPPNISPYNLEQLITGNAINDNLGEAVRSGAEKINRNLKTLSRVIARVEGIVSGVAGDTSQIKLDIASVKTRLAAVETKSSNNENNIAVLAGQVQGLISSVGALTSQLALKANVNSPRFTGSPELADDAVPPTDSNNNRLVTSAWVRAYAASATVTEFSSGTRIIFSQFNAPTGWVRDENAHDRVLRMYGTNDANGFGVGGTRGFTEAFVSGSLAISGDSLNSASGGAGRTLDHVLGVTEIPSHIHRLGLGRGGSDGGGSWASTDNNSSFRSWSTAGVEASGGGQGHSHETPGHIHNISHSHNLNINVRYMDAIVGVKS